MTRKSGWKKERDSLISTPVVAMWLVFGIAGMFGFLQVDLGQFDERASYSTDRYEPGFPNIYALPENEPFDIREFYKPRLTENVNTSVFIPEGSYRGSYIQSSQSFSIRIENETKTFLGKGGSSSGGGIGSGGLGFGSNEDTTANFKVAGKMVIGLGNGTIQSELSKSRGFTGKVHDNPTLSFGYWGQEYSSNSDNLYDWILYVKKSGAPYDIVIYDSYYNTIYEQTDLSGYSEIRFPKPRTGTDAFRVTLTTSDNTYNLSLRLEEVLVATKNDDYVKGGVSVGVMAIPAAITIFIWAERKAIEE